MEDFDRWNEQKKKIEAAASFPYPEEGEVWWVRVGKNVGDEEDGKHEHFERPVLALRVFNRRVFLGIPMTSASKNEKSAYYFKSVWRARIYFYLLLQARLYSSKRLVRLIRRIDRSELLQVKNALKRLLRL